MKITHPLATGFLGLLAKAGMRRLIDSLETKVAFYDPRVDPIHSDCPGPVIYVFWHEYILAPVFVRGHCDAAILLSRHRDAEFLARIARLIGMQCVRGSSYRGAATAVRELLRSGRRLHLGITPDGPRGPRRQMAPGTVYLASKLRMPIVCVGVGHDRPWRLGTWDRFAVPRPGSRMRAIFSPPISISPDFDRAALDDCRVKTERLLNRLTVEAEAWAEAGTRKREEVPIHWEPKRHCQWQDEGDDIAPVRDNARRVILPPAA